MFFLCLGPYKVLHYPNWKFYLLSIESAGKRVFLTVAAYITNHWWMENGQKGFTLLGPASSCANAIAQIRTRFTKTVARYPARKKKNLQWQRPVIFTLGVSRMTRSQSERAPQTSGQRQMFLLLLMQNRWEGLFLDVFLLAIEDWNILPSVASWSVKIFKQWYDFKV